MPTNNTNKTGSSSFFITIGRHKFTERQLKLLELVGLKEEKARIGNVKDTKDVIAIAKEKGADTIVIQGLPPSLLMQLLQHAKRENIKVLMFRIQAITVTDNEEEAKKIAREHNADIVLPSREGKFRVSKTVALEEIEKIEVITKTIATLD